MNKRISQGFRGGAIAVFLMLLVSAPFVLAQTTDIANLNLRMTNDIMDPGAVLYGRASFQV